MLVVLGFSPERSSSGAVMFDCRCDCGQIKSVRRGGLQQGQTRSCGCLMIAEARKPKPMLRTHGYSSSYFFTVWGGMMDRCYNPESKNYPHYGGRGIRVCDRWQASIADFHADMGDRPTDKHTIDRIDNDGDYTPENCRWATVKEQANNRRTCRILEFQGESMNVAQWAERLGVSRGQIKDRLRSGWSVEDALTTPKKTTWIRRVDREPGEIQGRQ